jgi:hypothetical protein
VEPALAKPPDLANRELCTSALFAGELFNCEQFANQPSANE